MVSTTRQRAGFLVLRLQLVQKIDRDHERTQRQRFALLRNEHMTATAQDAFGRAVQTGGCVENDQMVAGLGRRFEKRLERGRPLEARTPFRDFAGRDFSGITILSVSSFVLKAACSKGSVIRQFRKGPYRPWRSATAKAHGAAGRRRREASYPRLAKEKARLWRRLFYPRPLLN